MNIKQLKYVVSIAKNGSINETAKQLFISQPSLTNAIKDLEEEIGIQIFIRNNKGVIATNEGNEFLGYARQVLDQFSLIEERYIKGEERKILFSVSSQHYSFAINAFVDLIKLYGNNVYDFTLRETQTFEIINDVSIHKSEIGVIYTCSQNEEIINRLVNKYDVDIRELFVVKPHVYLNATHPLSKRSKLSLSNLEKYPYLSYEQGENNSFYFSEEVLSYIPRQKNIKVSDRATLFNLLIGLNGYTVSTGIVSKELNGENIVSIPLDTKEYIKICVLTKKNIIMSTFANKYIELLKKYV